MTTDWKALCAKLNAAYKQCMYEQNNYEQWLIGSVLTDRADAALAEPEPQPADNELAELVEILHEAADDAKLERSPYRASQLTRAASLLERLDRYDQALSAVMPPDFKDWWQNSKEEWPDIAAGVIENLRKREELAWEHVGRLAAQPISVAERLPGPGDCDAEGECYWFDPKGSGAWYQDTYQGNYSHWLPVRALPVP